MKKLTIIKGALKIETELPGVNTETAKGNAKEKWFASVNVIIA